MRNRLKIILAFLLVPLLLACNLTNLIAAGPSGQAPAAQRPQGSAQPGANVPALEGQTRQLVSDFLKSLQQDPSGESARAFLAPDLSAKVQGADLPQLIGMDGSLPNYTLSAVTFSPDAAQASVDATVFYQQPANLRFHLVQTPGGWKIDQISKAEAGDGYPSTAEEVVQAFLTSYQENPDKMSRYLSAKRLAELPAGGAVGMLNIHGALEGSMIQSAAVNPTLRSAAVTVNIRAGGEDAARLFTLTQENGQWKIDNIDNP